MLKIWNDGYDSVVAESEDDAWEVWCEHTGKKREDYEDSMEWKAEPDDKVLTICYLDPLDVPHSAPAAYQYNEGSGLFEVVATCAEWAESIGRGWLCSSEW